MMYVCMYAHSLLIMASVLYTAAIDYRSYHANKSKQNNSHDIVPKEIFIKLSAHTKASSIETMAHQLKEGAVTFTCTLFLCCTCTCTFNLAITLING